MQTSEQTDTPAPAAPKAGRGNGKKKLAEGEGVIRVDLIRPSVAELVALYRRKVDAAAAYKDAIQAIATKAGVNKKALGTYIKAKAEDKLYETHARIKQLELLFEEI
jgi:hypothetical protein